MNNWNNMSFIPNNPMIDTMNQNRMGFNNSYMPAPRYELIKVNGEAGARNFKMAPNSATLLLDETAPIVWLVQTDGSGLITPTPFDIVVHQPPKEIDINNLAARVAELEERLNEQSNTFSSKQSKKQRQRNDQSYESTNDSTNQRNNESN